MAEKNELLSIIPLLLMRNLQLKHINVVKRLRKAGFINKLSPFHHGIMPVRVLQHNLIAAFERMNPSFLNLTRKVIAELGLQPGIRYSAEREKVEIPFETYNKIFIQETFLSYVWCISFSLTILYEEVIVKMSYNDLFGKRIKKTNFKFARNAYALWNYGLSLIDEYSDWSYILPNPEKYSRKYKEIIPKVNGLYITAMTFVLGHEFAHIELQHNSTKLAPGDGNAINIKQEKEADARSMELVLNGLTVNNSMTVRMGILIGLCSLLFFSSKTRLEGYPDTDDRIDALLHIIDPPPNDAMWGIATLAFKLWDNHFGKNLHFQDGLASPKDLYYSIKNQIENINAQLALA